MNGLKKEQWERNNAFYTNRSFSRDVRKVRLMWGWAGVYVCVWAQPAGTGATFSAPAARVC